jgi:hypothetical protein
MAVALAPVGGRVDASGPCGTLAYDPSNPPVYQHVVVVMDENVGYTALSKPGAAPYLSGLATACGSELNMHAATHPSQPNYMAATSGVASGATIKTGNDNIFHQLQAAGSTWAAYEESMPSPCAANTSTVPAYKNGHNPPYWYTDLKTPTNTCKLYSVPMSPAMDTALANDALPAFTWVTPNLCDDMHADPSCGFPNTARILQGDTWLSTFVPKVTSLPSYQAGQTLLLITWDEGSGAGTNGVDCTDPAYYPTHADCRIPTIVVSPYVVPGAQDSADHNLYGLLGTVQDILGLPRLGRAAGATSLRPGLAF